MEKFKKVPTLSGNVSFSAKLHTVFGRQYRVIKIQDNKPQVVGTVVAKVVAEDLSVELGALTESERRPGDILRASSVSRSFDGVQALARRRRSSFVAARSSA